MNLISLKEQVSRTSDFCSFPGSMKPEHVQFVLSLRFPLDSEAFVFEHNGKIIGRVLLQASTLSKEDGHFGLFYLLPEYKDLFPQLWNECEKWFKQRGMKKVTGPYIFTTFFPYRFRYDQDQKTYPWEPTAFHDQLSIFLENGFGINQIYFSNFLQDYGVFETKGTKELEEATKLGFSHRTISLDTLKADIKDIYQLSMKGFTDNFLFAPIPFELFENLYLSSFKDVDLRLSCMQYDPLGKAIGFNFTFFDGEQIVIKTVCVDPDYRGKGLLNAGIRYSMLQAFKHYPNIKRVATALIHEDNGPSKHVANQTQNRMRHEYVLLEKGIS